MKRIIIEHHPDVIPFTGIKRDGTIAPPDMIGMTIRVIDNHEAPPKPLAGVAALYRRKRRQ